MQSHSLEREYLKAKKVQNESVVKGLKYFLKRAGGFLHLAGQTFYLIIKHKNRLNFTIFSK